MFWRNREPDIARLEERCDVSRLLELVAKRESVVAAAAALANLGATSAVPDLVDAFLEGYAVGQDLARLGFQTSADRDWQTLIDAPGMADTLLERYLQGGVVPVNVVASLGARAIPRLANCVNTYLARVSSTRVSQADHARYCPQRALDALARLNTDEANELIFGVVQKAPCVHACDALVTSHDSRAPALFVGMLLDGVYSFSEWNRTVATSALQRLGPMCAKTIVPLLAKHNRNFSGTVADILISYGAAGKEAIIEAAMAAADGLTERDRDGLFRRVDYVLDRIEGREKDRFLP